MLKINYENKGKQIICLNTRGYKKLTKDKVYTIIQDVSDIIDEEPSDYYVIKDDSGYASGYDKAMFEIIT